MMKPPLGKKSSTASASASATESSSSSTSAKSKSKSKVSVKKMSSKPQKIILDNRSSSIESVSRMIHSKRSGDVNVNVNGGEASASASRKRSNFNYIWPSSSSGHGNSNSHGNSNGKGTDNDKGKDKCKDDNEEEEEEEDVFGMQITHLLNSGTFSNAAVEKIRQGEEFQIQNAPWFPLLSTANAIRVKNALYRCKSTILVCLWPWSPSSSSSTSSMYGTSSGSSKRKSFLRELEPVPLLDSFYFLCHILLFVALPLLTFIVYTAMKLMVRIYIFFFSSLAKIFVNWEDVTHDFWPKFTFAHRAMDGILHYLRRFDQELLLAHHVNGRERWKDVNIAHHQHQHQPSQEQHGVSNDGSVSGARKQNANANINANVDWNSVYNSFKEQKYHDKTVNHLVALNFVHCIMTNEKEQAAASQASRKNKNKHATSNNNKNHQRKTKRKNNNSLPGGGNGGGGVGVETGIGGNIIGVSDDNNNDIGLSISSGSGVGGVQCVQSRDAIEMIDAHPTVSPHRGLRKGRSSFRKASKIQQTVKNRMSQDGVLLAQAQAQADDSFMTRSRMYSEADMDDYDDECLSYDESENENENGSGGGSTCSNESHADSLNEGISYETSFTTRLKEKHTSTNDDLFIINKEKNNQKWLDVGAKIGMRILKSEQVQNAIAKTQNLSIDTTEGKLYDDIENEQDNHIETPTTRQIVKPFHSMWMSTGEDMSSNNEEYLDGGDSESFDASEHEFSLRPNQASSSRTITSRRRLSLSPQIIPRRTTSHSLSPLKPEKRRWRSQPFHQSMSVPNSPLGKSNKETYKLFTPGEFETNVSITSSEAIQWVPREFDANRHIPASMAINHGVISDNKSRNSSSLFLARETHTRKVKVSTPKTKSYRPRQTLMPGVKIILPIFSSHDISTGKTTNRSTTTTPGRIYQSATVISCERIFIGSNGDFAKGSNGLAITVYLDKSFLRNGSFAKMMTRIPDSHRHFPRHSKYPIGAAVATSFGLGILVGWRPNDDCHIVRSLWHKRGQGSCHAYLNRNALHEIMEASVGFKVVTSGGSGKVVGYINGGRKFSEGKYLVQLRKHGRTDKELTEMNRSEITLCKATKFIPILEQLREAAKYQMQIDNYEAERLQRMLEEQTLLIDNNTWRVFSEGFELFLSSFIKAAQEDENFDSEISGLLGMIISFLEDFELGNTTMHRKPSISEIAPQNSQVNTNSPTKANDVQDSSMWVTKLFGDVMKTPQSERKTHQRESVSPSLPSNKVSTKPFGEKSYKKVYAILRTLARTIAIAKAGCTKNPNLKMALAIIHEMLLFVHNVVKVHQRNITQASIEAWKKTMVDFTNVFGPMNSRFRKICNGIIERLEEHGKIAKLRAMRFADFLIADDRLIESLEKGDISDGILRLESAAVKANILDEEMREQYHKLCILLYNTLAPRANQSIEATSRNGRKFKFLAKAIKILATPARSALSLLTNDDVLDLIERVLLRVFDKEKEASQIINIYSWNFRSFRYLRLFNNLAITGTLWAPVLDAADEEFSWAVSRSPKESQEFIGPISKLFSLGVARFHQIHVSDSKVSADWLEFLMEDEAIKIIQQLDGALMLFLTNFCYDMKEMMYILPYYSSIDEDILNLIDEVDLEQELKEIGEALADVDKFPGYVREKSSKAISSFLDYLPKMSIPIERREIGDNSGWCITCRGRNDKDLTLSHVHIEKDNLLCNVFGSQNVLGLDEMNVDGKTSINDVNTDPLLCDQDGNIEVSILDHVAELVRNAQSHGCWDVDSASYEIPRSHSSLSPLDGLPLSEVLICAVDLWENLQIDDDELLEIAIREISYQIQMHKGKTDDSIDPGDGDWPEESSRIKQMHDDYTQHKGPSFDVDICNTLSIESNNSGEGRRFDPRKDPTVLYLGMNQLTCRLDDFNYRLEPVKSKSIFDPVFEGVGSLKIKNASIKIRVECRKERISKLSEDIIVPVLQVQELDIGLEQVQFQFKETGADWLLNKVVENFTENITQVVRDNLKEQISLSIDRTLDTLNRYIAVNPEIMLKILGISIEDLEENVAFV